VKLQVLEAIVDQQSSQPDGDLPRLLYASGQDAHHTRAADGGRFPGGDLM